MLRDDILISVCIHDPSATVDGVATLERLSRALGGTFRYWEILLAVPADADQQWISLFRSIPNLRLLRLRQGLDAYGTRATLAAEAIGDVVMLASLGEVDYLDTPRMLQDAHHQDMMVIGDRGTSSLLDATLGMAGNGSGFRVNARFMQTIALPRRLLTRLQSQPEQQLALRFPPRDRSVQVRMHRASPDFLAKGRRREFAGRLRLAQRLIVSSAPNVLLALSVASFLTALGGVFFLTYVVGVWLFLSSVQPGWLTISGILGVSATFLGLVGLGLSTGMQKIIDLLDRDEGDDVLEELGQINVYAGITEDLNVYYEGAPETAEGGEKVP